MNGQAGDRRMVQEIMGFIAVVVTAVIMISVGGVNPSTVTAVAEVAGAYLAWRMAATRPAGEDGGAAAG
jgi:hypothetical protein